MSFIAPVMEGISKVGSVVGNVASLAAPFIGGQAETEAAESFSQEGQLQAQAEEFNIGVARGEIAISEAARKLARTREKKSAVAFLSTQEALFAKSGVTLAGSPLDVMEDTAAELELDIIIGDINASIAQSRLKSEIAQRQISAAGARAMGSAGEAAALTDAAERRARQFLITAPRTSTSSGGSTFKGISLKNVSEGEVFNIATRASDPGRLGTTRGSFESDFFALRSF